MPVSSTIPSKTTTTKKKSLVAQEGAIHLSDEKNDDDHSGGVRLFSVVYFKRNFYRILKE